jgi:competence protein ComEC
VQGVGIVSLGARLAPLQALAEQRGRLVLFVPVCMGLGIGGFFALPFDPTAPMLAGVAGAGLVALALAIRSPEEVAPLAAALVWVAVGFLAIALRTHLVAGPVLGTRYYGPIEGRIILIDRGASGALRLTLDQVALGARARVPHKVRVALHGQQDAIVPEPGLRVMLTGHLSPPLAPSEPGGFDFRRLAWYEGLGAVGYTRTPVLAAAPAQDGAAGLHIHRLRMQISAGVQDRLPNDAGAFASAILTGDRSALPPERVEDLRRSNLAHLLAISGLHMGLLTGFVFGALRLALALVPYVALRAPTRKLAALGALAAGAFYLALSGGNVATQRAYIMVAVMLVAVILDRRAISLRSVAIAATLILLWRPEALVQAGFQMSFAATTALVAVFRALNDRPRDAPRLPRWLRGAAGVVICSVVAGLATAPIAAVHFNRVADYGLLANLVAVPLMGSVIMPAAVLAAALWPFGLEWVGLRVMEPAIDWILGVARFVSGLEGAVSGVAQPTPWVLPVLALGGLWLVIWQGRARWAGAGVMALAFGGWMLGARPLILIAPDGALVGVMTKDGRALSRPKGAGFAAESWLESDGDLAAQDAAYARTGAVARDNAMVLRAQGAEIVHLTGKAGLALLSQTCLQGRIVVTSQQPDPAVKGPCLLITPRDLARSGARAGWMVSGQLVWKQETEQTGARHWAYR